MDGPSQIKGLRGGATIFGFEVGGLRFEAKTKNFKYLLSPLPSAFHLQPSACFCASHKESLRLTLRLRKKAISGWKLPMLLPRRQQCNQAYSSSARREPYTKRSLCRLRAFKPINTGWTPFPIPFLCLYLRREHICSRRRISSRGRVRRPRKENATDKCVSLGDCGFKEAKNHEQ
jgi:hypothetical protein